MNRLCAGMMIVAVLASAISGCAINLPAKAYEPEPTTVAEITARLPALCDALEYLAVKLDIAAGGDRQAVLTELRETADEAKRLVQALPVAAVFPDDQRAQIVARCKNVSALLDQVRAAAESQEPEQVAAAVKAAVAPSRALVAYVRRVMTAFDITVTGPESR